MYSNNKTNNGPMGHQIPGLKCPRCSGFIPTTIQELLTSSFLVCPHCFLQLTIDKGQSQKALSALMKVEHAQKNIERTRNRYK